MNLTDRIEVTREDITKLNVDAIVNAANSSLLPGGGVDGAIHDAAGPQLMADCARLGGCYAGQAKIAKGYRLPARFVILTVGPVWRGGGHKEAEMLASCYRNCFELAREHSLKTLAFPAISCGVYGYPVGNAASIAVRETCQALSQMPEIERVLFTCFTRAVFAAYESALKKLSH